MEYGYVRVSTKEQNEVRQLIAMREFGIEDKYIYTDKQSGRDFERKNYRLLMKRLKEGDVIVITKEKQAAIVVLDMPLLDTRRARDLTGTLIADIVLQLLSYVAQTEREFIKQRQAEGIAAAKQRGVKFGRRPKVRPAEYISIKRLRDEKKISAREAGRRLGVTHSTFLNWARADEKHIVEND